MRLAPQGPRRPAMGMLRAEKRRWWQEWGAERCLSQLVPYDPFVPTHPGGQGTEGQSSSDSVASSRVAVLSPAPTGA